VRIAGGGIKKTRRSRFNQFLVEGGWLRERAIFAIEAAASPTTPAAAAKAKLAEALVKARALLVGLRRYAGPLT
jgi:hypothetical protein